MAEADFNDDGNDPDHPVGYRGLIDTVTDMPALTEAGNRAELPPRSPSMATSRPTEASSMNCYGTHWRRWRCRRQIGESRLRSGGAGMSKRDALPDAEPVIADFTQGLVKDLLGACDQCADLLLTVRALEFAVIGFCWFCDQFTAAEDDLTR